MNSKDNTFFKVNNLTISKLEFKSGTWVCNLQDNNKYKFLIVHATQKSYKQGLIFFFQSHDCFVNNQNFSGLN